MTLSEVANIASAVGLIAAAIGLVMTAIQIRAAGKTSRGQFLHDLEGDAQRFQPLFKYLLPADRPVTDKLRKALQADELLLFSALNFFEKVQLLVQNGSVELKSVDRLFAGRFFLIVHSPLVQSLVLLNQSYIHYFTTVAELYQRWYSYRKDNGLLIFMEKNIINEFLQERA